MNRDELVSYLNDRLDVNSLDDASVNGLQVQGKSEVNRVGLATDAALAVYQKAAAQRCDMLITHHGLIWHSIRSVTGRDYEHIRFLIEHGINLYGAHLPLDAHAELGNNACLADLAGLVERQPFGEYHGATIGFSGRLPKPLSRERLAATWRDILGGESLILPFGPDEIRSVGIISGGGSSLLGEAVARGFDCFVTGEGRHEDYHAAKEAGINVIYLGHYHSETLGVKAVGEELEARLGLETVFIDEPTIL